LTAKKEIVEFEEIEQIPEDKMITSNGSSNGSSMSDSEVDKLLADALKKENYSKEYNQRPDVKVARKIYNELRQAKQKVGSLLLHEQITREEAVAFLNQIKNKQVPDLKMYKVSS